MNQGGLSYGSKEPGMNIALIHYAAPPIVGGVETVLARQAHQLVRAGHHVVVLAGRGQKWDVNIQVITSPLYDSRYPKILKLKSSLDKGEIPENFKDVVSQIESSLRRDLAGIQVVILHNVASLHKNLALTAALHNLSQSADGRRWILWHHDLAWTTSRYADELYPSWPWDLLRTPWPGVKQVTISEARRAELAELMSLDSDDIAVIPAGLELQDFLSLHTRTVGLLEHMDLGGRAPILLTPVRITRRKNLELAVAALAALKKEMPAAVLIITGPPGAHNPSNQKYLAKLQKLRDKYKLRKSLFLMAEFAPDGLPEATIADFYRLSDALLLPSREEGFGIPLLEAGISGIPIFCSNIPQLHALAGDSATYFSPDDDPKYVAGLIVLRLQSDPLYRWRVRVRQEYTWEAIYQQKIVPLLEEK
jgi:glycosyltransferase involved in cell wall biosynthesis